MWCWKILGLKKQNPRSGSRPGVEKSLVGDPFFMGAVWVSGAPVAKPIPKIKTGRSAHVIHPGRRNRARGAGDA